MAPCSNGDRKEQVSPALGNPPGFQQGVRIWDPGRAWAKVGVGLSHSRKAINRFSILFMD